MRVDQEGCSPSTSRWPFHPPDYALELLKGQVDAGKSLLTSRPIPAAEFSAWKNTTSQYLIQAFGDQSANVWNFGNAGHVSSYFGITEEALEKERAEAIEPQLALLDSAIQQPNASVELSKRTSAAPPQAVEYVARIELLLNRFHLIARQIRSRHEDRLTLSIADEYDVQDLLHALLRLFFDDIRPEEWTPSYAGRSARMDFLLKPERAVLEVKKTRPGLLDREIGEQLIIDIARYRNHPDCDTLFCFVYDPDSLLSNPRGLERDLTQRDGMFAVRVLVAPVGT